MKITNHARLRGAERLNLPLEPFKRLAGIAMERGLSHAETTGKLNRYVTSLYMNGHNANNIRIYGDFVYLFKGGTLITVLALPNNMKAIANKLKNKK